MENKEPLSPHIQIYRWHISSLVSISHRITGIINIIAITIICFWASSLLLGENNYEAINSFLNSFIGKFIILGITWSFLFQILSEIRHLIMDLGYGFEIQNHQNYRSYCYIWLNNFYCYFLSNRKKFYFMISATKKWIFLKISGAF